MAKCKVLTRSAVKGLIEGRSSVNVPYLMTLLLLWPWPCEQWRPKHGLGELSRNMSLTSYRETYWWIVRNFQILVSSAVNVCKQYLQTASASGALPGLRPSTSLGWGRWDLRPADPLGYSSQMKIPASRCFRTILIYESDLDILKTCLHTKMKFLG